MSTIRLTLSTFISIIICFLDLRRCELAYKLRINTSQLFLKGRPRHFLLATNCSKVLARLMLILVAQNLFPRFFGKLKSLIANQKA
jgi:hypothetical protein